jgi:hypothetical protein
MSKLRTDSTWSGLSEERRNRLAGWLLEENLPYHEVLERVQKEFGLTASRSSLARYYRHLMKERAVQEMFEVQDAAAELNGTETRLESLRTSAWKMIGKQFLEKAIAGAEVKELAALGRLMAESEEREIRRSRVALAREKFQFRAAKAVWKHLPLMEKLTREDQEREDARIDEIRLEIFGTPPPDINYDCYGV